MSRLSMMRLAPLPVVAVLSGCASLMSAPPPSPPPEPQFVVPPGAEFVSDLFGYSQAVRVGPWITVSAQPGFDVEKRGFPDNLPEQAAAAFRNLATVLAASGASMDDVVSITTYQLDMSQFNEAVDARNEAFGLHRPTWTAVGVQSLPLPSMLFQVSATAYVKPGESSTGDASDSTPSQAVSGRGKSGEPAEAAVPATAANHPAPFMMRPGY